MAVVRQDERSKRAVRAPAQRVLQHVILSEMPRHIQFAGDKQNRNVALDKASHRGARSVKTLVCAKVNLEAVLDRLNARQIVSARDEDCAGYPDTLGSMELRIRDIARNVIARRRNGPSGTVVLDCPRMP